MQISVDVHLDREAKIEMMWVLQEDKSQSLIINQGFYPRVVIYGTLDQLATIAREILARQEAVNAQAVPQTGEPNAAPV